MAGAVRAGERWQRDAVTLYRVLRHPRTPWYARAIAACGVGYLVSPIQLIPSIIPVIGQLDDVCVIVLAGRLTRAVVDPALIAECEGVPPPRRAIGLLALSAAVGAAILFVVAHLIG